MRRLVLALVAAATLAPAVARADDDAPRVRGPWLFDGALRDTLRADSSDGRRAADDASSVFLASTIVAPFANAAFETWWLHGSWLDAGALALVSTEAFGLTFAVTSFVKTVTGRERPDASEAHLAEMCADPEHAHDAACRSDRNASFLSGHAATAFTGAGLVCAERAYFGTASSPWDGVLCGAAIAGATATALLRITADRHYATDTLAGAGLGLAMGFLLPIALHFSDGAPIAVASSMRMPDADRSLTPVLAGMGIGLLAGAALPFAVGALRSHDDRASANRRGIRSLSLAPWVTPEGGAGLGLHAVTY